MYGITPHSSVSMTLNDLAEPEQRPELIDRSVSTTEKILCPHCRRTATNGISCKGICVADSDY